MKRISVREFQLRAGAYLKELPVVLTQYNVPRYIVLTLDEYSGENGGKVLTDLPQVAENPDLNVVKLCEGPFCKKVATHRVFYDNPETFVEEEKLLCDEHLKILRRAVNEIREC